MSSFYSIFKTFNNWPIFLGAKPQTTRTSMKKYINASYKSIEIIDPQKSLYQLLLAKKIIEEIYSQGGKILFFTNQPGFFKILNTIFPKNNPQLLLLEPKWIPGLLTNWSGFKQSLSSFETKEFNVHQRKTLLRLEKRYKPFIQTPQDYSLLRESPDLLVCFEASESKAALNEAFKIKIPSIAIANTDIKMNPEKISYLIPANTRSFKSLYFFSRILLSNFSNSSTEKPKTKTQ